MDLFSCDAEKVEALIADFREIEIRCSNIGYELTMRFMKVSPVHPVGEVIGDLQHPAGQPVLHIQDIETGEASYRATVFIMILHYLFVSENTLHIHFMKNRTHQFAHLRRFVFTHMPGIAGERHEFVGGGQNEGSAWFEHTEGLFEEEAVVPDVFDHLEGDDEIHGLIFDSGQRRDFGLMKNYIGQSIGDGRGMFVYREILRGERGQHFQPVAFSAADFQYISADAFGGFLISDQMTVMDYLVGLFLS